MTSEVGFKHAKPRSVNYYLGNALYAPAFVAFRSLVPFGRIDLSWNADLPTGTFGMCVIPCDPKTGKVRHHDDLGVRATIFLSQENCEADDGDRYAETLCHELAHAAVWVMYPEEFDMANHGEVWGEFMGAFYSALLAPRLEEGDPQARILLNRGIKHGGVLDAAHKRADLRREVARSYLGQSLYGGPWEEALRRIRASPNPSMSFFVQGRRLGKTALTAGMLKELAGQGIISKATLADLTGNGKDYKLSDDDAAAALPYLLKGDLS